MEWNWIWTLDWWLIGEKRCWMCGFCFGWIWGGGAGEYSKEMNHSKYNRLTLPPLSDQYLIEINNFHCLIDWRMYENELKWIEVKMIWLTLHQFTDHTVSVWIDASKCKYKDNLYCNRSFVVIVDICSFWLN